MGIAVVVAGGNMWRMNSVSVTPMFWSRCKSTSPRKQTPPRHPMTCTRLLGQRCMGGAQTQTRIIMPVLSAPPPSRDNKATSCSARTWRTSLQRLQAGPLYSSTTPVSSALLSLHLSIYLSFSLERGRCEEGRRGEKTAEDQHHRTF